jgi:hypothetical protein
MRVEAACLITETYYDVAGGAALHYAEEDLDSSTTVVDDSWSVIWLGDRDWPTLIALV